MKTNSAIRTTSWAAMAVAAMSTTAGASISNGFEAPTFAAGTLHGQSGWLSTSPLTSTANARSGSQHFRMETTWNVTDPQSFGPTFLPAGSTSFSTWFSLGNINTVFGLSGVTSSFQTSWGMMVGSGSVLLFGNGTWFDSGTDVAGANQYHEFATVYNPGDQSRDYYLNGALIYHQTTGLPAGVTTDLLTISLTASAGNHVDIDDIGTYAIPAPGSIALACIGGLIAGRRRR
jgi:hypothetical protein